MRRILAEQFPGRGGQALLAQVLDRQTGYISRCLNGEKPIGEVFARHVEERLHLPRYWLDGERLAEQLSTPQHALLIQRFDALTPTQQAEFLELLDSVLRRNAEIFECMQRRTCSATREP